MAAVKVVCNYWLDTPEGSIDLGRGSVPYLAMIDVANGTLTETLDIRASHTNR